MRTTGQKIQKEAMEWPLGKYLSDEVGILEMDISIPHQGTVLCGDLQALQISHTCVSRETQVLDTYPQNLCGQSVLLSMTAATSRGF